MIQKQQEYENKNIRYAALLFVAIMSLNAKTYAAVPEQLINWSHECSVFAQKDFINKVLTQLERKYGELMEKTLSVYQTLEYKSS